MIPSTSKTALVTGATGTTGSALLRLLEAKGVAVRAMLRRQGNVSRLGSATAAPVDGVSGRGLIDRRWVGAASFGVVGPTRARRYCAKRV